MKKLFRLSLLFTLFFSPDFIYAAPPTISALTIREGPTEGASYVGIIGTGFTKNTVFKFDDQRVIFKRFIDSTKVYILTVEHPSEGSVDVTASNSDGTATLLSAFTFSNRGPHLIRINAGDGVREGNTPVQFYGTHFTLSLIHIS